MNGVRKHQYNVEYLCVWGEFDCPLRKLALLWFSGTVPMLRHTGQNCLFGLVMQSNTYFGPLGF